MGMFDKIKEAKAAANAAMASVGAGQAGAAGGMPSGMPAAMPNMEEQLRYRDLTQKLKASGIEAPAVIRAIRRGDTDALSGSIKAELDLTIKPAGGDPYEATVKQAMLPAWLDTLTDGEVVTVKYDPDSPTSALIYGNA